MFSVDYFKKTYPGEKFSIKPIGYSKQDYGFITSNGTEFGGLGGFGELGAEDESTIKKAWNSIKDKLYTFRILGNSLLKMLGITQNLRSRALKVKPELVQKIDDTSNKLNSMKLLWNEVISSINKYEAEWQKLTKFFGFSGFNELSEYYDENYERTEDTELGFIFTLPIAIAAVGGLTFVASKGISLLKDYAVQRKVLQDLENEIITAEQAATVLQATNKTGKPFVSLFGGSSSTIPIVMGVGLLAMLFLSKKK